MDLHSAGNEDMDNKWDKDVKYILYSISPTMNVFSNFMRSEIGMHLLVDASDNWEGLIFFFLRGTLNGVLGLMKYRKIIHMGKYLGNISQIIHMGKYCITLTSATEENKQSRGRRRRSMRKLQLTTVRRDLGNIWADLIKPVKEPAIPLYDGKAASPIQEKNKGRGESKFQKHKMLVWLEWRECSRRWSQGDNRGARLYRDSQAIFLLSAWSLGSIVPKSTGFGARSRIYVLPLPLPSCMTSGKLLSACFTICKMEQLSLPTS